MAMGEPDPRAARNDALGYLSGYHSACASSLCTVYGCQGHCGGMSRRDLAELERQREQLIQDMQRRANEDAQRRALESIAPEFITIAGKRYKLVPVEGS